MPDTDNPDSKADPGQTEAQDEESFGSLLSQYEHSHTAESADGGKQIIGTVISASADRVLMDIGYKIEGVLTPSSSPSQALPNAGDRLPVTIRGRNEEGYYTLSPLRTRQPTDWESLQHAFAEHATITGTITGLVKGGLTVDVGVRAFLPASRSGAHDAAEMEKLVGTEIRCQILKVDAAEEDVVVDRRSVLEEEQRTRGELRLSELREGDRVTGEVRSIVPYGAFIDLGGIDGLLHISDIAWSRVAQPQDVLTVGQHLETIVLKVDAESHRISLGLKQLQTDPWENVTATYHIGDRVHGTVTRTADFGAFVELEPGVEGLIHLSEMSWTRKTRKPSDLVKPGDRVEAMVLSLSQPERKIGLGLKQALGDPWADVPSRFPEGSIVEGTVTSFTAFGAFVQVSEGVEGMIHISEIGADRRLHHPREALEMGQTVRAQVVQIDSAKRQMKLSIKRMAPVSLDEYLAEHKLGDIVTGRIVAVSDKLARVELGEGIQADCPLAPAGATSPSKAGTAAAADLGSLRAMLEARWKGRGRADAAPSPEPPRAGQIRSFRVTTVDPAAKTIALVLAE